MHMTHAQDAEVLSGHSWIVTLAEVENVTDAAAMLGTTQPTLSRRLATLESALGASLFDRPGRRLRLNDAGRIYVDAARRADFTMAVARARIAEMHGGDDELRLGFLHSFGPWLVPHLLGHVRRSHPHARFQLVQDAAETICRLVREGDLDVGIVSPKPRVEEGLQWRSLIQQPIALAVPEDHPLASRGEVTLRDAAEETFVTMPAHYGMRRVLDEACAEAGFRPRLGTECQELGTVRGLVEAGLGVALLPREQRRSGADGVRLVTLCDPALTREIGIVRAADRVLPAVARSLADAEAPPLPFGQ